MEIDNRAIESNLSSIKEMLLDEDKIVTYISLSKELCVHVNISKMLLHRVIQIIRKEKPNLELNVNYIISGISDVNKVRTSVCSEKELQDLKPSFKMVHFEHVYSVSKSNVNSKAAYLLINNFKDFNLCLGSIKNNNCNKHSTSEISNFKSNSLLVSESSLNKPSETPIKKIKTDNSEKKPNIANGKQESKVTNDNTNLEPVKKEIPSPKKETNQSTKQNTQKVNGHKAQKGIAGFFNKNSTSSIKKVNVENEKIKDENIKVKVEKMDCDEPDEKLTNGNKNNKQTNEKNSIKVEEESKKENSNSNANKNKMLNQIKKSSKVDKKRKRVLHVSDSESDRENSTDDIENEKLAQDSDDEIPSTPMANNIKITSGIVNPRKKRKVVDKTYTDEEGYILTKKVEVYESCSEEEITKEDIKETIKEEKKEVKKELSPKNKVEQKTSKKKISPPQKGKQATLTNFFKRK